MSAAGLIARKFLVKGTDGGSIYEFKQGFAALLKHMNEAESANTTQVPARYQRQYRRPSTDASSSSSLSSGREQRLLQEWSVDDVIWPEIFDGVDRGSLLPYLKYMPSVGYCQDFVDKVAAVIDYKKTTATPIADPVGFLFGCLKKMQVNPPPGWKSRAVRLMEEEERRLRQEAEELKALKERLDHHRCEIFFLKLPEEERIAIDAEVEREIGGGDSMIQRAKRDQRRMELIRQRMDRQSTGS
jgi:hypothetical protein